MRTKISEWGFLAIYTGTIGASNNLVLPASYAVLADKLDSAFWVTNNTPLKAVNGNTLTPCIVSAYNVTTSADITAYINESSSTESVIYFTYGVSQDDVVTIKAYFTSPSSQFRLHPQSAAGPNSGYVDLSNISRYSVESIIKGWNKKGINAPADFGMRWVKNLFSGDAELSDIGPSGLTLIETDRKLPVVLTDLEVWLTPMNANITDGYVLSLYSWDGSSWTKIGDNFIITKNSSYAQYYYAVEGVGDSGETEIKYRVALPMINCRGLKVVVKMAGGQTDVTEGHITVGVSGWVRKDRVYGDIPSQEDNPMSLGLKRRELMSGEWDTFADPPIPEASELLDGEDGIAGIYTFPDYQPAGFVTLEYRGTQLKIRFNDTGKYFVEYYTTDIGSEDVLTAEFLNDLGRHINRNFFIDWGQLGYKYTQAYYVWGGRDDLKSLTPGTHYKTVPSDTTDFIATHIILLSKSSMASCSIPVNHEVRVVDITTSNYTYYGLTVTDYSLYFNLRLPAISVVSTGRTVKTTAVSGLIESVNDYKIQVFPIGFLRLDPTTPPVINVEPGEDAGWWAVAIGGWYK